MDIVKIGAIAKSEPVKYWVGAVSAAVVTGTAIGVLVELVDAKVRKIREERIFEEYEELSETYVQQEDEAVDFGEYEDVVVSPAFNKPDISQLTDYTKFHRNGPTPPEGTDKEGPEETESSVFEIISEKDFVRMTGNLDGYASVTGTWFPQDEVLAGWDNDLEPKDPAATIGEEAVRIFDDPEVKAVYVRNTADKVLFEIVRCDDKFQTSSEEG